MLVFTTLTEDTRNSTLQYVRTVQYVVRTHAALRRPPDANVLYYDMSMSPLLCHV
jgi:hypothetical protein